jgi:hypothetical protein
MSREVPTVPNGQPVDDEGLIGRVGHKVLGKSWKTSLSGFIALVCGVLPLVPGMPHAVLEVCRVVLPIAVGGGLYVAKDKGVSGTQR